MICYNAKIAHYARKNNYEIHAILDSYHVTQISALNAKVLEYNKTQLLAILFQKAY